MKVYENQLKCENCCYLWKDNDDEYACCHWEARCPDDKAPCEYDEYDFADDDLDEYGY